MSVKVIFLDVDGVLNTIESLTKDGHDSLEDMCLSQLVRILESTGAQIVLTSTWRLYRDLRMTLLRKFRQLNIHSCFMGQTIELMGKPRSEEIKSWLKDHPEVERFVILDDDYDAGIGMQDNFFLTNYQDGLSDEIADSVIQFFNDRD